MSLLIDAELMLRLSERYAAAADHRADGPAELAAVEEALGYVFRIAEECDLDPRNLPRLLGAITDLARLLDAEEVTQVGGEQDEHPIEDNPNPWGPK